MILILIMVYAAIYVENLIATYLDLNIGYY